MELFGLCHSGVTRLIKFFSTFSVSSMISTSFSATESILVSLNISLSKLFRFNENARFLSVAQEYFGNVQYEAMSYDLKLQKLR